MGTGIQAQTLYSYLKAVSLLSLFDCYTPMRIKTNTSRNETCALTTSTQKRESNPAVHALLYAPEAKSLITYVHFRALLFCFESLMYPRAYRDT